MTTDTVRRRLSGPARRQRIEAAAVEVFAERGYDATSVGEIATAAGVTRTVLYDHFRSKRELYLQADETVPYGRVVTGAVLLQQAGATKIGFQTDPGPSERERRR